MKIVVYGLSVTSSWGNGHATTYRSLLKALAQRGHSIVFIEKDVPWYRGNRDLPNPSFCSVVMYEDWSAEGHQLLRHADDADVVVVGSYFPDAIAATEALFAHAKAPVMFYDIDTPITMTGLRTAGRMAYLDAKAIPGYAAYLSFTSGPTLVELRECFGARKAEPLLCSVDPELYRLCALRPEFACDLSYLGTYAKDRQGKLMSLLNGAAEHLPQSSFIVAGPQYPADVAWAHNVRRLDHVAPADHPPFYSSSRFTLNLTRSDMVAAGHSPSVRLFEAAACGAAMISDTWTGIEEFFTPGEEILLPGDTSVLIGMLSSMSEEERLRLGSRARDRVLTEHSSQIRARQFEAIVAGC
jgi:spore maturation protein CgeB